MPYTFEAGLAENVSKKCAEQHATGSLCNDRNVHKFDRLSTQVMRQ